MKLERLSILVTGGAGFIGGHLVEALAQKNRVTVYDNFSSAALTEQYLRNLPNVRLIKGNILEEKKVTQAMKNTDVVFHLAVACIRLSLNNPLQVHSVNATGTLKTLLVAHKARVKRFIYISSSEVYGNTNAGKIPETHPILPTTVYGMSKYQGELYSQLFSRENNLPTTIIRPFNTYGPRSHFNSVYGEVIPRMCIRALCGLPPVIFGDGTQTRDFTYVSDTVSGIFAASQQDKLLGDVVNIAHGQEISIRTIATIICKLTGASLTPIHKPARPHDIQRLAADTTKAQKILPTFDPRMGIQEGIKKYLAWLMRNYPNPKTLLRQIPETNW